MIYAVRHVVGQQTRELRANQSRRHQDERTAAHSRAVQRDDNVSVIITSYICLVFPPNLLWAYIFNELTLCGVAVT